MVFLLESRCLIGCSGWLLGCFRDIVWCCESFHTGFDSKVGLEGRVKHFDEQPLRKCQLCGSTIVAVVTVMDFDILLFTKFLLTSTPQRKIPWGFMWELNYLKVEMLHKYNQYKGFEEFLKISAVS